MELDLAAPVWKLLLGETLVESDLASMDERITGFFELLRNLEAESWADSGVRWCVRNGAGRLVCVSPLSDDASNVRSPPVHAPVHITPAVGEEPDGQSVLVEAVPRVAFEDREQYIAAAKHLRMHEFDQQVAAIRQGFLSVAPGYALPLFSWREIETKVCGENSIDLAVLKSIAVYDGEYRREGAKHPVIQRFWRAMETFSDAQRTAVVGFAWGRSRLPPSSSTSGISFNIDAAHGGDDFIPTSSTCDFRLHLPEYSSDHACRTKLLYAVQVPAWREAGPSMRTLEYGLGCLDEVVALPLPSHTAEGSDGVHYIELEPAPSRHSVVPTKDTPTTSAAYERESGSSESGSSGTGGTRSSYSSGGRRYVGGELVDESSSDSGSGSRGSEAYTDDY